MAELHVISALRLKRAEIAGHIQDLERCLVRLRENLASVDATIRLYSPDTNPTLISPKRRYQPRTAYFGRHEVHRLTLEGLRLATGPLKAADIAASIMRTKSLPDNQVVAVFVKQRVLAALCRLHKRGEVHKTGGRINAQWALTPALL